MRCNILKIGENIKTLFCIISTVNLIACTAGLRPDNSDKYAFDDKMIEILGSDVKIKNAINKSQTQISNVELSKDSKKLDEIIKLLKQDGWVFKGKGKGVDTYCLGKNNSINIITANSGPIIGYQGSILNSGDFSVNTVTFSYVNSGVNECNVLVMIDFKKIMTVYFGQYQPDFKPSIIRPNNSLATLHIPKENLSKIEMNEIRKKLKSDGWKEVENYGNYSEYCINKYQKIAILFPENELEKAKDGEEIYYSDKNSWSIFLYYNDSGIDHCKA